MNNQPGDFLDIAGSVDPETIDQTNWETAARMLWKLQPTHLAGVPNTVTGPPTTGARVLGELWMDQTLAGWRCTAAGSPGTWVKARPAMLFGQKPSYAFGSIAAATSATTTLTVTGATLGDIASIGFSTAPEDGLHWEAYVSATNTVTIRCRNLTASAIAPASRSYNVAIICA